MLTNYRHAQTKTYIQMFPYLEHWQMLTQCAHWCMLTRSWPLRPGVIPTQKPCRMATASLHQWVSRKIREKYYFAHRSQWGPAWAPSCRWSLSCRGRTCGRCSASRWYTSTRRQTRWSSRRLCCPCRTWLREHTTGSLIHSILHFTQVLPVKTLHTPHLKPTAWGHCGASSSPTTFGLDAHGGHGFESESFLLSTPQLFSLSFHVTLFTALLIKRH